MFESRLSNNMFPIPLNIRSRTVTHTHAINTPTHTEKELQTPATQTRTQHHEHITPLTHATQTRHTRLTDTLTAQTTHNHKAPCTTKGPKIHSLPHKHSQDHGQLQVHTSKRSLSLKNCARLTAKKKHELQNRTFDGQPRNMSATASS